MIKLMICKEKDHPKSPVSEKNCIFWKKDGVRDVWKKEIDLEYEYYLAELRAHRDTSYLIEERDELISKFKSAQIQNVELRKDIRALNKELYTMCHKNAHNSWVIDGLQELDEQVKQTQHFETDLKQKLNLAGKEKTNCEEIMSWHKHEIHFLSNKNEVDENFFDFLKPHTERLKNILYSKKQKNHQKSQEFIRELQTILEKGKEKNTEFEALMEESAVKSSWLEKMFLSVSEGKTEDILPSETEELESEKGKQKNLETPKELAGTDENLGENFKEMKEESSRMISSIDSMKNENAVMKNIISDCHQKLRERFEDLLNQTITTHEIETEISLVRDDIDRLNNVRRDIKAEEEEDIVINEEREELDMILSVQKNEGEFLKLLLDHFIKRMKDGFLITTIFLNESQEQILENLRS